MSDTPETDIEKRKAYSQEYIVPLEFARELERERDEARHEIQGWRNKWECAVEMAARAEMERDDARALAEQMSESNQVLLADVRFYRNEWEKLRGLKK